MSQPLLFLIQRHLRRTGMPPTRFGRMVVGDPRFVHDLRRGREARPATVRRVQAWIAQHDEAAR
ncbi:hypothetical protein [Sphingomonas morindae]|uniref:Transcriptional regulator n=1 Tax=Sphingomonas morindae TaxID=1541170 RepID=A0ABY4X8Z3_9SPHN|nr:hypothetical protein [Sphingomonas morindae]USI73375.1 hypothetical protein LHA26_02510 [Sphingomonas morindae]